MPRRTLVLAAHGSRDSRAAATVRDIARAVAAARPDEGVRCAFLDFESPGLGEVLAEAAAADRPCLVIPLLLTPAYHARIDIPAIVDVARSRGADVEIAPSLGSPGGRDRLAEALADRLPRHPVDGVVVAAAGSRDERALAIVDDVAAALQSRLGVPCRAGYASGAGASVAEAVSALVASGARNVGVAMYFVAPGVLPERAITQARDLGVSAIAPPIGSAPALVELMLERVDAFALAASR